MLDRLQWLHLNTSEIYNMIGFLWLIPAAVWFIILSGHLTSFVCAFIPLAGRKMHHGVHPDFNLVWLIVTVISIVLLYWNFKSAKRKA